MCVTCFTCFTCFTTCARLNHSGRRGKVGRELLGLCCAVGGDVGVLSRLEGNSWFG